jgi:transcriptional regulator with GAF, ATPase, and Fis domain
MHKVNLVAPSDSTVLILGETGSGKEVIARAIHQQSSRKDQPFIRVNCGAIPPELVDSELFGHEKGSFTGALENKKGWFERANRGTLFLDEVGELPLFAQVRLLRVLQEGTLTRVGAESETWVDVRIIAATHRDLQQHVHKGLFREDLWYRLHVFPIFIPPLRERVPDIPELATHFIKRASKKLGLPNPYITESQLQQLYEYSWPGNIREMQVVIERAVILGEGNRLELSTALGNINATLQTTPPNPVLSIESNTNQLTLDETIIIAIKDALKQSQGRVDGYFGAAKALNINPNTLRSKMRKYQITIEKKASN